MGQEDSPKEVYASYELNFINRFQRNTFRDNLRFQSRLTAGRTAQGGRRSVDVLNLGVCHTWVHPQGVSAAVCTTTNYDKRVAFGLLSEAVATFLDEVPEEWQNVNKDASLNCPKVESLFKKFQDPDEADKLTKIQ